MDKFDSDSDLAVSSPEVMELRETYQTMRNLFHCLAIAMVILTGTLFIYMFREASVVRRQSRELTRMINDYDKSNTRAMIRDFQARLYSYAQANPDFRPIYTRYYGTNALPQPLSRGTGASNNDAAAGPLP